MKKKPEDIFDPALPGPFGRMSRRQLDAESDQYNAEFSGLTARRVANAKPHPKKVTRRPRKPAPERAARVLITMTPQLLAATDAAADQRGLTRAGLISRAVQEWLSHESIAAKIA